MDPRMMKPEAAEEGSLRNTLEDAYEDVEAKTPMAPEDFAQAMLEHNSEAVRMAQAYLSSGDEDPTLRPMAEAVVANGQAESDALQAWFEGTPRSTQND